MQIRKCCLTVAAAAAAALLAGVARAETPSTPANEAAQSWEQSSKAKDILSGIPEQKQFSTEATANDVELSRAPGRGQPPRRGGGHSGDGHGRPERGHMGGGRGPARGRYPEHRPSWGRYRGGWYGGHGYGHYGWGWDAWNRPLWLGWGTFVLWNGIGSCHDYYWGEHNLCHDDCNAEFVQCVRSGDDYNGQCTQTKMHCDNSCDYQWADGGWSYYYGLCRY